jgi:uncharacterized membrane protein YdjX (TVP38/TMEM64 family)
VARRDAIRRLLLLALGLGALLALTLLLVPRDPGRIQAAVDDAGAWAPVAYVAVTAVLTVAFFPYPVVAGAGGLLFGVVAGAPLALLGEVLGASAAFLFARGAGRAQAERLAGPRLRHGLEVLARRGFAAVLLVRVLPGLPRHPANYAFGLTGVSFAAFVAGTTLGTAPRTLAYAALGGSLGDLRSPESISAVALLVVFGLLGLWLAARDPELRALTRRRAAR